ncbi:GNAT family N-acetyltransferase [Helicobacter sp. 12S02634-8]|nr:GNAT family N-acetyltransferase [Helicobacter sp. 12S02634-8]
MIQKPILSDIALMCALVEKEVQKGLILPRSPEEMANSIRSYCVAKLDGKIVGFCALHIYSPSLAEVRSLVVGEPYRGQGIASALVSSVCQEGEALGVKEFLVLTYRERLFKKLGFEVIEKSSLPDHKIWADCIKCKHFPICDEIALLKKL